MHISSYFLITVAMCGGRKPKAGGHPNHGHRSAAFPLAEVGNSVELSVQELEYGATFEFQNVPSLHPIG